MKKGTLITINPILDEKYKTVTFSPEFQKKHNDLVAALDRMKAKQQAEVTVS